MHNYNNIPLELRALRQWVAVDMSIDPENDQPCKKPINPVTGYWAKPNDPNTWGTFEQAVATGRPIGFVLSQNDPYTIIDLDNKSHKPATPNQLMLHDQIITGIESYIERSISGTGYHVVVKGSIPHGVNYGNVELYSTGRYMIFTGDVVKNMPIDDYNDAVNNMFNQMVAMQEKAKVATVELVQEDSHMTDGEIFAMASEAENAFKFNELCAGHWQQFGYPSQSEADYALLSMFTFYSKDNEQCRRLFRMTELGKREKHQTSNNWMDRLLKQIRAKDIQPVNMAAVEAATAEVIQTIQESPPYQQPMPPAVETLTQSNGVYNPNTGEVTWSVPKPPVFTGNIPPPPKLDILRPPGVLNMMADYIYQTSPYQAREYAVCAAIAMLAGCCARAYNISRTGLNQYLIVLGGAGTGKESMASGIGRLTKAINDGLTDPKPVDIGKFSSVQGLHKALIAQPCALSILGEVGNEFKIMLSPKCDPNRLEIKNAFLNLYNKSGEGESFSPVTYSKAENNMAAVPSPNLSLLGESVPNRFYETINESSAQDGFLSRLMVMEYTGERGDFNEAAENAPAPSVTLITALKAIRDYADDLQAQNKVVKINIEPTAKTRLTEFSKEITRRINEASKHGAHGVAELLVRSHVKALKLAGLGAVAIAPYHPVVTDELAQWAIEFVNKADSIMTTRFENGEIGEVNDSQFESIMRKCIVSYFKMTPKQRLSSHQPVVLSETNFISYSFIRDFCKRREPFKSHKLGYAKAIEIAIQDMVSAGIVIPIPTSQLPKAQNGHVLKAYAIGEQFQIRSA